MDNCFVEITDVVFDVMEYFLTQNRCHWTRPPLNQSYEKTIISSIKEDMQRIAVDVSCQYMLFFDGYLFTDDQFLQMLEVFKECSAAVEQEMSISGWHLVFFLIATRAQLACTFSWNLCRPTMVEEICLDLSKELHKVNRWVVQSGENWNNIKNEYELLTKTLIQITVKLVWGQMFCHKNNPSENTNPQCLT